MSFLINSEFPEQQVGVILVLILKRIGIRLMCSLLISNATSVTGAVTMVSWVESVYLAPSLGPETKMNAQWMFVEWMNK